MLTAEQIKEKAESTEEPVIFYDEYDDALIGLTDSWSGGGRPTRAVYCYEKCIDILMKRDGMDYEGAMEWMEYNTLGACHGPHTPVFVCTE